MNIFDFWAKYEYTQQTPGLIRIKKFFDILKIKPDIPVIHIAGTNGKGMTAHLLANFLWQEFPEQNIGLYTSPNLVEITERVVVNRKRISQNDFQEISLYYFPLAKKCQLSFFEYLTAVALLWFRQKRCSKVILETGLGGLYDATNICQNKILSIITSVSYDHEEYLGNTLKEIAREKAGIVKKDIPVILGSDIPAKVLSVFQRKSGITEQLGKDFFVYRVSENLKNQVFDYSNGKESFRFIFRQLGEKSMFSSGLAIRAAEFLKIGKNSIQKVLKNFQLAGRREIICSDRIKIILDGAHNPAAISSFFQDYKRWQNTFLSDWPEPLLFFTLVKEKNIRKISRVLSKELADWKRWRKLVIYRLNSSRAQSPQVIFAALKRYLEKERMEIFSDLISAVHYYGKEIKSGVPAIFFGSFYGVGEFFRGNIRMMLIRDTRSSPITVQTEEEAETAK